MLSRGQFALLLFCLTQPSAAPGEPSCKACHAAVVERYASSGMARTFGPATAETYPSGSLQHTASGRTFHAETVDGRLTQTRETPAGHRLQRAATNFIGSGAHARSYLVREQDNTFTQLPLTWYSQEKQWMMSPGYDRPAHYDFSRQIDHGCLFCHGSYPRRDVHFGEFAIFEQNLAAGIGCERCHGPSQAHLRQPSRQNIVNPSRLAPALALDVCLQCHLETTSAKLPHAVRRFGRGIYSFQPGERLSGYLVQYDHPAEAKRDDKFEINSSGYRLLQSACFRKSNGMTCTTCHDPHAPAAAEHSRAGYRKACLSCHQQPHNDGDCVSCHMPKRRTDDVVHVVLTDHRIQKPPTDPASLIAPKPEADATWKGGLQLYRTPALPPVDRDLYLGIALLTGGSDRPRGIRLLEQALRQKPVVEGLVELGVAYIADGRKVEGAALLRRALASQPNMPRVQYALAAATSDLRLLQPLLASGFGEVLNTAGTLRLSDPAAARSWFERAAAARPYGPEPRNNLGMLALTQGDVSGAERWFQDALAANPEFAPAYNNLGRIAAQRDDLPGALRFVETAVSLDAAYAEAQYNLGRLLQASGKTPRALEALTAAIRLNPKLPDAHIAIGVALGESGRYREAAQAFEEALRLDPSNAEARRNLELARRLLTP